MSLPSVLFLTWSKAPRTLLVPHLDLTAVLCRTMEQSFYLGHTDDILCLGHHAASDLIATGQVGKDPPIHVWNMKSKETVSVLKGKHLLD